MLQNLIIGAGPAGLAVAGRMRHANIPFEIIEQSDKIASAWHGHYDRLHLHTVKEFSNLPHLPFPADYPRYVPRQKLVEYYEAYAKQFQIKPQFNQTVKRIEKQADGTWKVSAQRDWIAQNVIIATGINRVPQLPKWQGQEAFTGTILHSRNYKNPQPFLNKKVLVVGMGNTGAEVAFDLSNHGIQTYLSVRGAVNIVPRDLNGRPVQVTSKQLAKIPFGIGDWLGTLIRKIYIGNIEQYGLKSETMHPAEQLRTKGKTPVIDIGTLAAIKAGKIQIVPSIDHFSDGNIVFEGGKKMSFDVVLLATGYRAKVEAFLENGTAALNQYGVPKQVIGTDFHEGVYFVGFDNYKLGGILGTIQTDSELIVERLQRQ